MRKFKENFIVRYLDKYMMLNLISFRRKVITEEQYNFLKEIQLKENNASDVAKSFLNDLYAQKQVLSNELIEWYDKQRQNTIPPIKRAITHVTINLTYDCNFKCEYCYQSNFNYAGKYLSENDIEKIYSFIQEYNSLHDYREKVEKVVISGGESLLEKNVEAINATIKTFVGSKIKIFTNGVNILKLANKIDYSKIHEAQVSLDGPDEVIKFVNRSTTANIKQIIDGILFLKNKGVQVTIISLVTPNTVNYIPQMLKLLEEAGILENTSVRFAFAINHSEEHSIEKNIYSIDEYLDLRLEVLKLVKNTKNVSVDALYELSYLVNILNRKANERVEGYITKCSLTQGMPLLFGPDHGIYWCSCTNMERKIGTFDDLPNKLDESTLLNGLLNRNIYTVEKCRNCIYRYACSTGCPLFSIHKEGEANIPSCGVINSIEFEEKAEKFLMMKI